MSLPSIRLFCALTLLALCVFSSAAFAEERSTDQTDKIIAAAKAAVGGANWDTVKTWHETGTLSVGGIDGTYEVWLDLPDIRGAQSYILGPAKGSQGWNGKVSWSTDASDQLRIETSRESIASAVKDYYQETHAFFFPDRYPAETQYSGVKENDGKPCDVLTIKPRDADPFEVWFDQASHLIVRMVDLTGPQPQTSYFSDFRNVDGLLVPFQTRVSVGDSRYDQKIFSQKIDFNTEVAAQRFDPPKQVLDPLIFPDGQKEISAAFRLINNHIYLPVSLDGKTGDHFIFDTGAVNTVSAELAKTAGIPTEGTLPGGGFGDSVAASGLAKIALTDLAGAKLKDQVFASFDLGSLSKVEGVACDGLVGYEIARRAIVKIDYANSKLTVISPDAFHPPKNAVKVPFKFNNHIPTVEGEIDGLAGEFDIDTGNRGSLSIMRPFAEKNQLKEKYQATTEVVAGYGLGGSARGLLVRPHTLKIGGVEVKAPVGLIELGQRGASAATQTAGNLGSGLLKRFTLTLDYPNQVLYLQPNANFSKPDVFDRSGLWVMSDADGTCEVTDVVKGGPGAKAGLQPGDHILAIDGAKLTGIQIADLREKLKQPPGTKVRLEVRAKNGHRYVTLTLADLI
jgi:outer membrane lipoprotein-sorting protein